MHYLADCGPIKVSSCPKSFHSLPLYVLLSLVFGMNTGSRFTPLLPSGMDLRFKSDTGEVITNVAKDQKPIFHHDLCLLDAHSNSLVELKNEKDWSLSLQIEMQSLQFHACPVAGPLFARKKGVFIAKVRDVKQRLPEHTRGQNPTSCCLRSWGIPIPIFHSWQGPPLSSSFPARNQPELLVMLTQHPYDIGVGTKQTVSQLTNKNHD